MYSCYLYVLSHLGAKPNVRSPMGLLDRKWHQLWVLFHCNRVYCNPLSFSLPKRWNVRNTVFGEWYSLLSPACSPCCSCLCRRNTSSRWQRGHCRKVWGELMKELQQAQSALQSLKSGMMLCFHLSCWANNESHSLFSAVPFNELSWLCSCSATVSRTVKIFFKWKRGACVIKWKCSFFSRSEKSSLQKGVFSILIWCLYCDVYQWVTSSKSEKNRFSFPGI